MTVYQVGQEDRNIFLAMELLHGQTLDDFVNHKGVPNPSEIIRLAREIATGLDAIHRNGLIHRDLKPNNIWVEEPGRSIKLLDFGLVRHVEDDAKFTGSGFIVGTPAFMSPEQARGTRIDTRSDLFSVGSVLYFLCSGSLPFQADSAVGMLTAVTVDRPRPIKEINPHLPTALADLIMQLLEKQPDDRPASAKEVVDRLRTLETPPLAGSPRQRELAPLPVGQTKSRPRKVLGTVMRVSAIAAIAAIIFYLQYAPFGAVTPADGAVGNRDERFEKPAAPETFSTLPNVGAKAKGVLILDDCDPIFRGKAEYNDNLTLIDHSGEKKFRTSGFNVCESVGSNRMIAVDSKRDRLWVVENCANRIRRVDLSGNQTFVVSLEPGRNGSAIAVDSETGHLWALIGSGTLDSSQVIVYDERGTQVAAHPIKGFDIVYDRQAKAFWVAGSNLTKIDAASGKLLKSVFISSWFPSSVDVDAKSGVVWIAVRSNPVTHEPSKLVKFNPASQVLTQIDLGAKAPYRVSINPNDGSVWIANHNDSVQHFSADGQLLATQPIAALTVQTDTATGDVWVVTPDDTQKITSYGAVTKRVSHASRTNQAWIALLE